MLNPSHLQQAILLTTRPKVQLPTTDHVQNFLQSIHQPTEKPTRMNELISKLRNNPLPYCHESEALNLFNITNAKYLRKTFFGSYSYVEHNGHHIYTNDSLTYFKIKEIGGFYSLPNYSSKDMLNMILENQKLRSEIVELQQLSHKKSNQIKYLKARMKEQSEKLQELQSEELTQLTKLKQRRGIKHKQSKISKLRRSKR